METSKENAFKVLNAISVKNHTEKKGDLTYLSWAWAWAIAKQNYPDTTYRVFESPEGLNYFTDGRTCYVKVGVTIEGVEMVEYLPVMNARNNSIPFDQVTSMDVNKAIQRALTKALARHGLGLHVYSGEDLPTALTPGDDRWSKAVEFLKKGGSIDTVLDKYVVATKDVEKLRKEAEA